MSLNQLTLDDIEQSYARIRKHIHCTPVHTSQTLDDMFDARLLFKCENFQRTGAFKVRGAFNGVLSLGDKEAARGVVTSSSGNQAAALSLAASVRGIPAYVVMPRFALAPKVAAVRRYGGEIFWIDSKSEIPTAEDYDAATTDIERERGATLIHPYNTLSTIAGQGTCALELIRSNLQLDLLLAPVGGGGLLAGAALTTKSLKPETRVIGCEPEMANDAQRSLREGRIIPQSNPHTIADGLRTSLGTLTFPLISSHVDDIVTVSEDGIIRAMRLLWETLKIVIEPSSAVPVAAILERRVDVAGMSVGIILSGGNADLDNLPWSK
jgi:threonine dehydratase